LEAAVRTLRCERGWGLHRIAYELRIARSTVYALLRRLDLQRLDLPDRVTRQVIRITQSAPGEQVFDPSVRGGTGRRRTARAERFIKTLQWEWAYFRPYHTNPERLDALPIFLVEHNAHRLPTTLGGVPLVTRNLSLTSAGTNLVAHDVDVA
jgi:hypothetical protein